MSKKKNTKVITLAQIKGGCGKTTISAHIIGALLKAGKTVAAIDADSPQFSLSDWFDTGYEKQNLQLATAVRAEDLMAVIEHFDGKVDFIVTDLAPRLADMTRVGVAVSDLVIIPVNTDLIEIRALRLTLELMDEAKEKIPDLNYFVMTNKFQSHNDNHQVMRQGIADQYGCPMLESSLGMRKAYPDAVGAGVTIHDISPKVVKAVDEMNTLLDEIFSKLKG
ncbi:ParA family protein [Acinetobacter chengduensis]|uniref:ParA family protein n=1 Tax=Acinetobacter chengduensis TaxID=2420890 RepID=A0ABX9TSQ2_9GAMM|nr:ParA family protein [Acinetobacter chengduensis]RLL19037.1 ParA family protein [Acinetobacter chengduensis]